MLRLRWFDPEPDDLSTPIDWRFAALIIATLFLNFAFWMHDGAALRMSCSLPLYAVCVGAVALLFTALFFVGPALAGYTAKRPLLGVVENSLGSIPAYGFRFCCVAFPMLWIAKLVSWLRFGLLPAIMRRDVTSMESGAIAAGILVFVFITSLQSMRTSAKLALFTNKLGLAILVAASIRVRQGLPAALNGYPNSSAHSELMDFWHGLSLLAFYVAPLAFLAANFGHRSQGRRAVAMTALMGMAGPLTGTLLLTGVIGVATLHSGFYQPSSAPNVAMALWGRAAHSGVPGRMLVAAITTFGAMRFGIRSLAESASMRSLRSWWSLVLLGCLAGVTGWFSVPMFEKPSISWRPVSQSRQPCLPPISSLAPGGLTACGNSTGLARPPCLPACWRPYTYQVGLWVRATINGGIRGYCHRTEWRFWSACWAAPRADLLPPMKNILDTANP